MPDTACLGHVRVTVMCQTMTVYTGKSLYKDVASDHDSYDLATHDVSAALPESRVLHLRGRSSAVTHR